MLEEFKKAKYQDQGGTGSTKMSYYKEIEEIIRDRRMNNQYKSPTPSTAKVDSFMRFTDEGMEDAGISFVPVEGGESQLYRGRVIVSKWGDYTRRIGIDCSEESIKEAIKWAFRLRTKRAFWLEDEDEIVINGDRDMPLGNYMLHLDEGLAIKVCIYDESDHNPVRREDKMF